MSFMYQELQMTADEFLSWQLDQEELHELSRGHLHALPERDKAFFRVLVNVTAAIRHHLRNSELAVFIRGEPLVIDAHHVMCPDAMVATRRQPAAPVWTLEIVHAASRTADAARRTLALRRLGALAEHVTVDLAARTLRVDRRLASGTWTSVSLAEGEMVDFQALRMRFAVSAAFAGLDGERPALALPEFLAWDRLPGRSGHARYEFSDGAIVALSGARLNHERVVRNVVVAVSEHLDGTGCEVFGSNLRLACDGSEGGFLPDASIVCDAADLANDEEIRRPVVLIEVVSRSTQRRDRSLKREHYLRIPSLKEYVLIDYRQRRIDIHRRQEAGTWSLFQCIAGSPLTLTSIDFVMPADKVYARVRTSGE